MDKGIIDIHRGILFSKPTYNQIGLCNIDSPCSVRFPQIFFIDKCQL